MAAGNGGSQWRLAMTSHVSDGAEFPGFSEKDV